MVDPRPGRRSWLPWLIAGAVLVASALAFFPGVLLGGDFFFCRDAARIHLPMWTELQSRMAHGELPLWFPYEGLGEPFLGGAVAAAFHPIALALRLLPVVDAMRWTMLAAFATAFLGTFALGRALGNAVWSALAGALAFTYCGALVSLTDNPTYLFGGAVFPLFVLGLVRAPSRPLGGAMVSAIALALAGLAGDIQTILVMAVAGALLVAVSAGSWRERGARLGWLALTGIAGVLLASVQLFPSAATLAGIDRAAGLAWSEATLWSMHPLRLPELFFGDLIRWVPGSPAPNLIRQELIGSVGLWSVTLTVGAPLLFGALFACVSARRTRWDLAFAAAALLMLVLALGRFGGLYWLAYHLVPLWAAFRYPEKLALHASLFIAVLGARGLELVFSDGRSHRRFFVFGAVAAISIPMLAAIGSALAGAQDPRSVALASYLANLGKAGALSAAIVVALGVLAWRQSRLYPWAVPLLCALQLFPSSERTAEQCTAPRWVAEVPSSAGKAIAQLEGGTAFGRARVTPAFSATGTLKPNPEQGEVSPAVASSLWEREVLYPDSGATLQLETMARILPVRPARFTAFEQLASLRDWPLFNTKYVLTRRSDLGQFAGLRAEVAAELPELDVVVVRLLDALPRAFVAEPLPIADVQAARPLLDDPEVRAGRRATVETSQALAHGPVHGSARVVSYRPEEVDIEAELDAPGAVVLNDSIFDGWRATVDDVPTAILPANMLVRAVLVGAGKHRVVFRFPTPRSLVIGAITSAISWLVLLGLALVLRWRRRSGVNEIGAARAGNEP